MKRHLWSIIVSALGVAGVVGCSQCGHQPLFPNAPWNKGCGCAKTTHPGPAPVGLAPGQPMPLGPEAGVAPPPGSTLTPPPGSAIVQPPASQPVSPTGPGGYVPPAPSPPAEIRGYGPVSDNTWHAPANGGVRLAIPEIAPSRDSVRLSQPEIPGAAPKPIISESRTSEPPAAPSATDIRLFVPVYDHVASGLRPAKLEGLDWLKSNGFRAVLYLRQPTDNEETDRHAMERRSFKYLSLEVTPQNLRQALDQFNSIINDSTNQPLFVYSNAPMIAGTLWYLHFRTADRMEDNAARAKAATLGLEEEQTDANRPMWLAIQKTLEQIR